ncbi:MAG TPA: SET domain-containing protein-lysine N-methyltransferase [Polyangiaceae bacterium]|jgi:SET domain-containing protein|nr:SET domain-containing protein-lysine N-methyltransferase [Polyangiaceae bacterium]
MKFTLAKVAFRDSAIEGRGVFALRRFEPGDKVVDYAPEQRKVDVWSEESRLATQTKLSLLSDDGTVIIPDTRVPGGWLCNHSCRPNASIHSRGTGRIECVRTILPKDEVTIFYGWVTRNQPERDPCRCGSSNCRGFINFDISDAEARVREAGTEEGERFRKKLSDYFEFLRQIGQEQAKGNVLHALRAARGTG